MRLPAEAGDGEGRLLSLGLANSSAHRESAVSLINRRYGWRGYGTQHRLRVDPLSMTFTASLDEAVVGTITLTVDSDGGLAADDTFRDVLNSYRRVPGAKICELTKLAFDAQASSKPMLAALFHVVFMLGSRLHDCTDLFIEVNPRHRRFYRVMLGFEQIGEVRTNNSVAAPSQLMRLQVSQIQNFIDDCEEGASGSVARSLYPNFLSAKEQAKVVRVLTNFDVEQPVLSPRVGLAAIRPPVLRRRSPRLAADKASIAALRAVRSLLVRARAPRPGGS